MSGYFVKTFTFDSFLVVCFTLQLTLLCNAHVLESASITYDRRRTPPNPHSHLHSHERTCKCACRCKCKCTREFEFAGTRSVCTCVYLCVLVCTCVYLCVLVQSRTRLSPQEPRRVKFNLKEAAPSKVQRGSVGSTDSTNTFDTMSNWASPRSGPDPEWSDTLKADDDPNSFTGLNHRIVAIVSYDVMIRWHSLTARRTE